MGKNGRMIFDNVLIMIEMVLNETIKRGTVLFILNETGLWVNKKISPMKNL